MLVGAIGFVVDGSLLVWLMAQGNSPYLSRAISFPAALVVTFFLNRTFTFGYAVSDRQETRKQLVRYGLFQLLGALVNYGVFSLLISQAPRLREFPVIPLGMGAVFGMAITFAASSRIFRQKEAR